MTYRVGNHQPQNVYRDDAYIGVMFDAENAALVVAVLNAQPDAKPVHVMRDYDQAIAALDQARHDRRSTVSGTAIRAGFSRSTLSEALRGNHGLVGSNLFALAHALGYDLALVPREDA